MTDRPFQHIFRVLSLSSPNFGPIFVHPIFNVNPQKKDQRSYVWRSSRPFDRSRSPNPPVRKDFIQIFPNTCFIMWKCAVQLRIIRLSKPPFTLGNKFIKQLVSLVVVEAEDMYLGQRRNYKPFQNDCPNFNPVRVAACPVWTVMPFYRITQYN